MSINVTDNSLVSRLNAADPNTLADGLRNIQFGSTLRSYVTRLYRQEPAVSPYSLSTVEVIALPDDAKAAQALAGYNRAGSVTGYMTPDEIPSGSAPSSGHVGVTPSGDLMFLGSDDVDDVDVAYIPARYDIVELTLPVVSNSATIPAAYANAPKGVLFMMEAESLAGTLVSKLIVGAPASSNSTTGLACLDVALTHVLFDSANGVTSARVKLAIVPANDMNALLEAVSGTL